MLNQMSLPLQFSLKICSGDTFLASMLASTWDLLEIVEFGLESARDAHQVQELKTVTTLKKSRR